MAAKFFTGLPLDGPDPECVQGYGEELLAQRSNDKLEIPKHSGDHSHRTTRAPRSGMGPVQLTLSRREDLTAPPVSACAEDPLAGFSAAAASDFASKESGADRRHQGGIRSELA